MVQATAAMQPRILHVHADTGSDLSGDGTPRRPYQTVNKALQLAHDSIAAPIPDVTAVHVHRSVTPVAPIGHGGVEGLGWGRSGLAGNAFPLRMVDGVDLVGVPDQGLKPVITIDESQGGFFVDWNPAVPKALVIASPASTLSGFLLDGQKLDSTATQDWPGLFVRDVSPFTLSDCEIIDFRDNLCIEASADATVEVSLVGCELAEAGPASPTHLSHGHASLWQAGAGTTVVSVENTVFRTSHDAVEIEGQPGSDHTFIATNGCRFEDNENGVEAVGGAGRISIDLSDCVFEGSFNIGSLAGGVDSSTAAVADRTFEQLELDLKVRNSHFHNSAYGFLLRNEHPDSVLDLGTAGDPGHNSFCLDFLPFALADPPFPPLKPSDDPYRVCLYYRGMGSVSAVGNWWYGDNQMANAWGELTAGWVTADPMGPGVNIHGVDPFDLSALAPPGPPGPRWGSFELTGLRWLRNYSLDPGGAIDFGDESTAPGLAPLNCGAGL
jgi:hypothetical protein